MRCGAHSVLFFPLINFRLYPLGCSSPFSAAYAPFFSVAELSEKWSETVFSFMLAPLVEVLSLTPFIPCSLRDRYMMAHGGTVLMGSPPSETSSHPCICYACTVWCTIRRTSCTKRCRHTKVVDMRCRLQIPSCVSLGNNAHACGGISEI